MKKILRNIFLSILVIILVAVGAAWYTLFGVSEKPGEEVNKYVTDIYGTTYLAVVDEEGVTYAVVTDEDGNRNAAKFENGVVGEITGNVNSSVSLEELPTNYTGPSVDVTAAPGDYSGDVIIVPTTTEPSTESTTKDDGGKEEKPTKPNGTTTTKPSGGDSGKLKAYRIKKYHDIIASGNFLMSTTMEDESLGSTPITIAIKNGNTYVETSMTEGDMTIDCKIIFIKSTATTYLLLDSWRKYTKIPADMLGDTSSMDMASALQADYAEEDISNVKVSEVEINGKKLILESYNSDGATVNYYFDGDALVRRDDIASDGSVTSTIFTRFTTDVPDSYFEIPDGYGYINLDWLGSMM